MVSIFRCNDFYQKDGIFPDGLWEEILEHVDILEKKTGKKPGVDYNYTTCPQCNIDWPQKKKDTSEIVIRWREDMDRYKVLFMVFFILFLIILIIYSIASQNHR